MHIWFGFCLSAVQMTNFNSLITVNKIRFNQTIRGILESNYRWLFYRSSYKKKLFPSINPRQSLRAPTSCHIITRKALCLVCSVNHLRPCGPQNLTCVESVQRKEEQEQARMSAQRTVHSAAVNQLGPGRANIIIPGLSL